MTEKPDDSPRVSGSLAAHYAPVTPLCLVEPAQLAETVDGLRAQGKKIAVLAYGVALPSLPDGLLSRAPADAAGFAHDLYARLRALDRIGADLILVEAPPNASQWHAITDRLRRAATGSGSNG